MNDIEKLHYELAVLKRMIEQLPEKVKTPFLSQFESVRQAHVEYATSFKTAIKSGLEDLSLEIKAISFDLIATRRERDQLQQKLDDQSD